MPAQEHSSSENVSFRHPPADSIRVLQFTDTHLYADPDQRLLGVRTQHSFDQCVRLARGDHWPPDAVILSGDLVHDASEAGYLRLLDTITELGAPACVLAGNHDHPATLAAVVQGEPVAADGCHRQGRWQIVTLDSSVPGTDAGHLDGVQLGRLRAHLEQAPHCHTLISVHHPPVAIGSAWMDRIGLRNGQALFEALRGFDNVRAILCGHIHQELDVEHESVRVLASPSTCVQFAPRTEDFAVDRKPPGYRWLLLHADGRIDTGVNRLTTLPEGLETESGGY